MKEARDLRPPVVWFHFCEICTTADEQRQKVEERLQGHERRWGKGVTAHGTGYLRYFGAGDERNVLILESDSGFIIL